MATDLDEDVQLFQLLRQRLVVRLEEREEDLRAGLQKTLAAKRDVLGQGARGTASEPGAGTHKERVLAWLRANPGRHTIAEIASGVGLDRIALNQALIVLHGAGLVQRPARGIYETVGPRLLPAHHEADPEPKDGDEPLREGPPRRETPMDRMRRMRQAGGPQGAGQSSKPRTS